MAEGESVNDSWAAFTALLKVTVLKVLGPETSGC